MLRLRLGPRLVPRLGLRFGLMCGLRLSLLLSLVPGLLLGLPPGPPLAPAEAAPAGLVAGPAAAPAGTSLPVRAGPPEGVWPLDPQPEVVAGFDPPAAPWEAGHRGVDLAGHAGQPVRSALSGQVAFAGSVAGKPVVTVDHGGRRTTYEPVVATVSVGDTVAGGDEIGRLAVLYGHCLPAACLHWGLRHGDTYLDPLSLVGGGPVRLLPLWREEPVTTSPRPWRPPLSLWRPPSLTDARPVVPGCYARGWACW